MTLRIEVSPETETRLKARAVAAGMDVETYVGALVEQSAKRPLSLDEISGPVADDFAKSGMTEDELSEVLEKAKHAMRADKRARRAS
jgi:hypothetical protein